MAIQWSSAQLRTQFPVSLASTDVSLSLIYSFAKDRLTDVTLKQYRDVPALNRHHIVGVRADVYKAIRTGKSPVDKGSVHAVRDGALIHLDCFSAQIFFFQSLKDLGQRLRFRRELVLLESINCTLGGDQLHVSQSYIKEIQVSKPVGDDQTLVFGGEGEISTFAPVASGCLVGSHEGEVGICKPGYLSLRGRTSRGVVFLTAFNSLIVAVDSHDVEFFSLTTFTSITSFSKGEDEGLNLDACLDPDRGYLFVQKGLPLKPLAGPMSHVADFFDLSDLLLVPRRVTGNYDRTISLSANHGLLFVHTRREVDRVMIYQTSDGLGVSPEGTSAWPHLLNVNLNRVAERVVGGKIGFFADNTLIYFVFA